MHAFTIASTPTLHFGAGKISILTSLVKEYGKNILIIKGKKSFDENRDAQNSVDQLPGVVNYYTITKEPSPGDVDLAVQQFHSQNINVVVAIGGGSVLDAGKAISAMLPLNEPVKDFLEGVGTRTHSGSKIPFIAVPTTAGTGSEATKNAVISEVGPQGFKKSLRHNRFVPDHAILDPQLMISTPRSITASTGMDAFTQLLEAYVSTASNSFTDAIAYEGLRLVSESLEKVVSDGSDIEARSKMALAAYYSGVVLANAGLGVVHGFASPIGGYVPIAHGVVCSRLMAPSNKITIRKLRKLDTHHAALKKYASAGALFVNDKSKSESFYVDTLLATIEKYTHDFGIPRLEGIESCFEKIIKATDSKNNPVKLETEELEEVLSLANQ